MMIREQIDELQLLISDLRMAMDIKEKIDAGVERGLINFADGTSIKVPVPQDVKLLLDNKIQELTNILKTKASQIK